MKVRGEPLPANEVAALRMQASAAAQSGDYLSAAKLITKAYPENFVRIIESDAEQGFYRVNERDFR